MPVSKENTVMTALTLANVVEVAAEVITRVAGDNIASHLNGEEMSGSPLAETIAVKLQGKLASRINL